MGIATSPRAAGFAAAGIAAALGIGCRTSPPTLIAPPPLPTAASATTPPLPPSTPTPVPSPEVPQRAEVRPPLVRILLRSAPNPVFPELGRRFACVVGGSASLLRGPLSATAAGGRAAIQVGAFADPANADEGAARLRAAGIAAEVRGDGETLRRLVALGNEGEPTAELGRRVAAAGFADQKPLGSAGGAGVTLTGEGGATVSGARVRLVPLDPDPVRVGSKLVRGEFEIRPGVEGVAVIDVVNLEEYLRGVVPAEMGPRAFPTLEALKAQAVAARTYAIDHLGDHAGDGYDLCDSQSCQVYEGVMAEQPLTDRAVAETAGEIVTYQGRPIDAMYHSTCAGHTEDGGAVFPFRAAPYLKGVACVCGQELAVGASAPTGPWLDPLGRLEAVGKLLAARLGVPLRPAALAARLAGRAVELSPWGLVRAFGLDDAGLLVRGSASAHTEESVRQLLDLYRLPLPEARPTGGRAAVDWALVVRLAQLTGRVQTAAGRLLPSPAGLALIADGSDSPRPLTGQEAVFERRGERWRRGPVRFAPGSPGALWCVEGGCPVVELEPLEAADAASAWTWWVREISLDEIGRRLGVGGVRSVTVTRRGVSGRALAVEVLGDAGPREVPGLAFRRALDLPDTLFLALAGGNGGGSAVRFLGRGWGHGVGMCQNGAYGLARAGASHVQILKTYYTGVDVTQWEGEKP